MGTKSISVYILVHYNVSLHMLTNVYRIWHISICCRREYCDNECMFKPKLRTRILKLFIGDSLGFDGIIHIVLLFLCHVCHITGEISVVQSLSACAVLCVGGVASV